MQTGLFDLENRYASLSKTGDPLERLNAIIDWEIFCPILERLDAKVRKSNAGRKATCRILMFKMLVLQRLNGLSDERLQYQVTGRFSFLRFLGGGTCRQRPRCTQRMGLSRSAQGTRTDGSLV